jgi:hypothetical protein
MDLRGDVGGSGYSRYIEGASVGAPYGDISKPTLNETTWNTFTYEGVINGEFTYAQALPNNGGNTFKVCVLISAATGWIELRKGGTSVRVVS